MTPNQKIEAYLRGKKAIEKDKPFSWAIHSSKVAKYCPNEINPLKFNWESGSAALIYYHPTHKYIQSCIWCSFTCAKIKILIGSGSYIRNNVWEKHWNEIHNLLDITKRDTLLNKIEKEIALAKI